MTRFLVIQLIAAAAGAYLASRKGRNWIIWGIACFIVPLAFVVLLFLPRALAQGVTKQCPECGRVIPQDAARCEYCKRELPIEMVECPKCGKFVPMGHKCPECEA